MLKINLTAEEVELFKKSLQKSARQSTGRELEQYSCLLGNIVFQTETTKRDG